VLDSGVAWATIVSMVQKYNTTGYPEAESGNLYQTLAGRVINGVETSLTLNAGDSDPSSGGTWAADQVGTVWFDTTNEVDAAGDDLGGTLKRWETIGATPTYGWRTLYLRNYVPSTATNILNVSATSADWTDVDVGGATTSDRALAVHLTVEAQESNPGAGVFIEFRKNGVTTDSRTTRVYPQVSGISVQSQIKVELDTSHVFEYAIRASGTTSANLRIELIGYEERI
jgi:hypothetical protein